MATLLIVGIVWMVLAASVAVLIGRAIRVADERSVAVVPDHVPASAFAVDALLPAAG